jgi:hypothetical protein
LSKEYSMTHERATDRPGGDNPKPSANAALGAKDVSTYPGNEEGSVQPTTVTTASETERHNAERERRRLEAEKQHHEEIGS